MNKAQEDVALRSMKLVKKIADYYGDGGSGRRMTDFAAEAMNIEKERHSVAGAETPDRGHEVQPRSVPTERLRSGSVDSNDRLDESPEGMRLRSGCVDNNDRLVSFLYQLGRDRLPVGIVEETYLDACGSKFRITSCFTNGWLARWAADLAARLDRKGG